MSPRLRNLLMTSAALLMLGVALSTLGAGPGGAQPTGPNVVGGAATVSGAGTNSVIVNQSSNRAIINWNTFNIATGGSATFSQPGASAITLNRVTGGLGPSVIDGAITANGRVFIINRDGMLFGKNAVINTAGFLASTNDIRNDDFMAGRMNFNIPGRPDASIVNLGTITASSHGFAALVAPGVRNTGTITATLGTVALASGNSFTLDMYGDKLIQLAVGDEIAGKVIDVATGKPLSSLVGNEGTVSATGGRVELTAAAARQVVDSVINNRGVIEANSIGTRNGMIVLGGATASTKTAGLPKQTINVSGKITATGKDKGSKGGTIQITGEDIQFAAAMLDVSGHSGGGKILVGGDYAGGKPIPDFVNNQSAVLESTAVPTAATVTVDGATSFNASATANGHGGKVILWSDTLTTFAGTILARGGEQGGNGGFVEVSGKETLAFTGVVDTRAPDGQNGALLLDPRNITITSTGPDNINGTIPFDGFATYEPALQPGASILTVATLQNALANGNVYVTTGGNVPGNAVGDINVNSSFSWSSNSNLTLSAFRNISIASGVTISASGNFPQISLRADNTGTGIGTVIFNGTSRISFTNPQSGGSVDIYYNPSSYTSPTDYSSRVTSTSPFMGFLTSYILVNSATDLQNISQNLSGSYALGRNIDASATATWNQGAGFIPIGNSETPFTGRLNGDGRTVDRLTINSSAPHVGLFGVLGGQRVCEAFCAISRVENLNLTNVDITASAGSVGAIAGRIDSGLFGNGLFGVTATGSVTGNGSGHVGGLVGENFGVINGSHANVAVRGGADSLSVGGLVGLNSGYIFESYAIGSVTSFAASPTGGLVGINTCCVISESPIGSIGGINESYATGPVSGPGMTGGLVGQSAATGSVVSSYWDIETTKQQTSAGGTGLTTSQTLQQSSYQGFLFGDDDNGGWFMIEGQTRPVLVREFSAPLGPRLEASIGSAHQLQLMSYLQGRFPSVPLALSSNINLGAALANPSDIWAGRPSGFVPVGSAGDPYTGRFEGNNFTIDGLRIAPTDSLNNSTGLFSAIGTGGVVQNLTLINVDITGTSPLFGQFVGALAGLNMGTIVNVHVSGNISWMPNGAGTTVGGLVGQNGSLGAPNLAGTIINSSSSADVTLGDGCQLNCFGRNFAGGLVGINFAGSTITSSISAGTVTGGGHSEIGGLVGQNNATITNSSSSATVASSTKSDAFSGSTGGLVGRNTGLISGSHATGNVSGNASEFGSSQFFVTTTAGGLVGYNDHTGQIVNSYATGAVNGANSVQLGGLAGENTGAINNSYATGAVTGDGRGSVGGLVGNNAFGGTITNSYATGAVGGSGSLNAGGLVGDNSFNATISNSYATGNVSVANTGATDVVAGGFVGANDGGISGSHATGWVTTTNGDVTGGGFAGFSLGSITNSYATGNVTANGASLAMLGGFTGGNVGTITNSHATGNVTTNAAFAIAGGFVGLNIGKIDLSYANGNVSAGSGSFVGGFVGFNLGEINQAYANGAVIGGKNSFVGGFVGANVGFDVSGQLGDSAAAPSFGTPGSITQSYALGSATGGNAAIAASFAALNLGTLDQVYGVGRVLGGTGSTLGGLVAVSTPSISIPDFGLGSLGGNLPAGTATNSFWDMQTTALTTSAGGTGMNTAVLSGGLPPGFDPAIWNHHSYPFLVNIVPSTQDTTPLPPVIPPVNPPVIPPVGDNEQPPFVQPPNQQINANTINTVLPPSDPVVPNVTQFVQQQQQQQQQQQGQQGADRTVTGSVNDPIRLDVGENRYFYIPPPGETRLATNEVVLQMPCDVPADALSAILRQHSLTVIGTQCLQQSGQATYRMQHPGSESVANVIRALAEHQVIAAAQANYLYALTEAKVQSATSQQGDPGQYVPEKLRLLALHRLVRGNGVPIAVIDSEIDGEHPDLNGTIANRYDATGVEDSPHAHGTGMAGAIVSHQKLLGVAPGARIVAIRAFSTRATNPESTTYNILRSIDWAVDNNVRIVNMSFAGPRDPSLERALKAAFDKGVILVAAMGNAGPRAPALYPAADPHVIAVTATDIDDRLFAGSNRGTHVAIAAPGVDILVPAPSGEYQVTTGTSVATAHISGVIALMLERNAKLTPADVRKILAASAKRLGPSNMFGAGLVDPVRAIEMATPRSAAAPGSPPTATAAARP